MRLQAWGLKPLPEASSGGTHPGTSRATALAVSLLPLSTFLENGIGLALLALAGIPGMAQAAPATGEVRVTTVQPLTLVKASDLDFASISAGPTAGTVRIDPSTGARTISGGAIAIGGTPTRAVFVGAASRGFMLNVRIGRSPTLTRAGGGSMTTTLEVEGGTGPRFFPGTGPQIFRVGGQLNVGANQPVGSYRGQFTLTVNYF